MKTRSLFYIHIILLPLLLMAKPNQDIPPLSQKALNAFHITTTNYPRYRIYTAIPKHSTTTDTYAILYLLDANAQFPLALNLYSEHFSHSKNLIIVGIGYNTPLAYHTPWRTYDYLPKINHSISPQAPNHRDSMQSIQESHSYEGGGAEDFYHFLYKEVITPMHKQYHIQRSSFFGHSFGGVFCLYVLFNHPQTFDNYICASPSLWWKNAAFIPEDLHIKSPIRSIAITLGTLESPSKRGNMTIDSKTLASVLMRDNPDIPIVFKTFANKTHGTVIPDAITFALHIAQE